MFWGFPWGWFLVSVPCGQRKCLIWFQFSSICWGLLCVSYHVVYIWKCSICIWKNVYFASLEWKALYISVKSIWSRALLNATISLLIFCLEDLSIFDSGVLKSPTIIVFLSITFLKSSKIFFIIWVLLCWVNIYLQCLCLLGRFFLWVMKWPSVSVFMALLWKSILSDMSIATQAFFFPCPFP